MFEATFISPSVISTFFKRFSSWYATTVAPRVIRMPDMDQEALRSNGAEYIAAGFPPVISSLDVTHVRLWGASANLKQVSTGKEKFPSRAFEVGTNHRRIISSVTKGFYGSVVDKTIVKFDGAVQAMRAGKYFSYEYELYAADGSKYVMRGGVFLLDNGYLQLPCMMERPCHDPISALQCTE